MFWLIPAVKAALAPVLAAAKGVGGAVAKGATAIAQGLGTKGIGGELAKLGAKGTAKIIPQAATKALTQAAPQGVINPLLRTAAEFGGKAVGPQAAITAPVAGGGLGSIGGIKQMLMERYGMAEGVPQTAQQWSDTLGQLHQDLSKLGGGTQQDSLTSVDWGGTITPGTTPQFGEGFGEYLGEDGMGEGGYMGMLQSPYANSYSQYEDLW